MRKRMLVAAAFCLFCVVLFAQPPGKSYKQQLREKRERDLWWPQLGTVIGTRWEYQDDGKTRLFQTWEKPDETTMVGCNFQVLGSDTTWLETMHLVKKGKEIEFIPDVFAEKPAVFVLMGKEGFEFFFENQAGVFPQEMVLERAGRHEISMLFRGLLLGKKVQVRSVFQD